MYFLLMYMTILCISCRRFFFAFGHADHRFDQHIDHCICFLYDMYVADQNAQFLRGSVLMPGVVFLILKLYQTALASLYIIIKISIAPSTIKKTGRRRITNKNEVIK